VHAVKSTNVHRPLALTAAFVVLAIAGCGSDHQHHASGGRDVPKSAGGAAIAAASDGATAVWRADVTPILCRYAQDIARSSQQIAQASSDAGGPVDASAPASAQAEYAGALQRYASLLESDYVAFESVQAPRPLSAEYHRFLASLQTLAGQAKRLSQYAHARNFTAIANEQNLQVPTGGQQVFTSAGITRCPVPTP